ncbi:uncharacterized protein CTHT_0059570 [Thermochaetoides thermophila DSM 1495]|uniref:Myb-like domain-containing protein n=1 Tax=Chaetomium thermophilum (strain DSM 1495 / CBS 144.50 / IMI 039719) TaxID=759272 RepID=G0SES8_CHATD|nr:hypothetical protein CTHT_0059570 [Thermochaetoides thermophila DSM 1495]EGS17944.1 hypothetical protein CTHT_0059570 [Thermochaetoides thermophila DSM 1495]
MLLPSALPSDSSQQPWTQPQPQTQAPSPAPPPLMTRIQTALFNSPPPSPPRLSTENAFGSVFNSCRTLQALIAAGNQPSPPLEPSVEPITPPDLSFSELPTPPLAPAASPPLKLRLRARRTENNKDTTGATNGEHGPQRMKIHKRSAAGGTARGHGLKRRRPAVEEDTLARESAGEESMSDIEGGQLLGSATSSFSAQPHLPREQKLPPLPRTPRRSRIAPEVLPLGLERSDFHTLASEQGPQVNNEPKGTDIVTESDGSTWSIEEDRVLVELVLEKLKLSKEDWQDCARSLGKDRSSLGRRWKSLMINGDIGLKKNGSRRARLYGTWR